MTYKNLKISTQEAEAILLKLYNLKGEAKELPGEVDFNFKIKVGKSTDFILKISRPDESENYLDFQQKLLQFVETKNPNLIAPRIIKDRLGNSISKISDEHLQSRNVRLLSWVPGRIWSDVNPQLDDLRFSLGQQCGSLTEALQGFDHPEAHREFLWDIAQSLWTKAHVNLFQKEEKEIIIYFQNNFEKSQETFKNCIFRHRISCIV